LNERIFLRSIGTSDRTDPDIVTAGDNNEVVEGRNRSGSLVGPSVANTRKLPKKGGE
jgi:hypothetical protein